jgi:hypothetical protein
VRCLRNSVFVSQCRIAVEAFLGAVTARPSRPPTSENFPRGASNETRPEKNARMQGADFSAIESFYF